MDVGLNAGKAVVQSIEQRAVVLIVVMGMGSGQRCGAGGSGRCSTRADEQNWYEPDDCDYRFSSYLSISLHFSVNNQINDTLITTLFF